ncbi:hypothetical protein LZG74_25425 [Dyadobacter sp. CY327]|uniref:hypothetical protein n=1 Tax=Dyadobacter sp. CY327 TaxID=2907301 RepID=UPI001F30EAF3|nr:hypothetical protein [Dyadobacter sp. CY327]MCE7073676.1 hypothetical protein [Dyadobacter sp. CY327]
MKYHIHRAGWPNDIMPCHGVYDTRALVIHFKPDYWPYPDELWYKIGSRHTVENGRMVRCLGSHPVWAIDLESDDDIAMLENTVGSIQIGVCEFDQITPSIEILTEQPILFDPDYKNMIDKIIKPHDYKTNATQGENQ